MQQQIIDTRPPRPEYGAGVVAPWGYYFGEYASNNPEVQRQKIYNQ